MKRLGAALVLCTIAIPSVAAAQPPTPETYRKIDARVLSNLRNDILDKWFPRSVDEKDGGFDENYRDDWSPGRQGERSIVYQSRLTWLSAAAALRFPSDADKYLKITRLGIKQLAEKQWDHEHGGFFWAVDTSGKPTPNNGSEKHAYGNAFGIYASAESYRATHDPAALDLAKKAFAWLDAHAHDAEHGGYYEALTVEGKPVLEPPSSGPQVDSIGTRYGQKSMNTHIHLLEALTTLHEVWSDEKVTKRTREVFDIILTKVYAEPGFQHMFFKPDWTPIPGVDSYGHDIETGYLLVEAATALGMPDDARTWTAARHLVDHSLAVGFDQAHGGLYDSGTVEGKNLKKEKIWWVEAETINAVLLMHAKFGKEDPKYWNTFLKQWEFISRHQVDPTHGGWYPTVSEDGKAPTGRAKSDRWTEGYHQGRAMLNVSETLEKLVRNDPTGLSKRSK